MRFGEAVINVCAQGMQRDTTPVILLDASQFSAAQTAGTTNLDTFSSEILGGLQRFLHGATERDAAFELQGDVFGDELRISFRRLDLDDIDVDFLAGHLA